MEDSTPPVGHKNNYSGFQLNPWISFISSSSQGLVSKGSASFWKQQGSVENVEWERRQNEL